MPNTYQTITVFPGQTVYLPKTAKVLGTDSTGDAYIDSQCLDLSNVENATCYFIDSVTAARGSGSMAYNSITLQGIQVNGVRYPFNTPVTWNAGFTSLPDLVTQVTNTSISSVLSNICCKVVQTTVGTHAMLWFKTFPSVGTGMTLYGTAIKGPTSDLVPDNFPIEWDALTKDQITTIAGGNTAGLGCGCGLDTTTQS